MNHLDQILPDPTPWYVSPTPRNKNKYRSFKYRHLVFVDLTLSRSGVINDVALIKKNENFGKFFIKIVED
jgi:hypothetical protein